MAHILGVAVCTIIRQRAALLAVFSPLGSLRFSREEILRDSRLQEAQVMYFVLSSYHWRVHFIVALSCFRVRCTISPDCVQLCMIAMTMMVIAATHLTEMPGVI